MCKKMLVPLDGSELAEIVFPYVTELAGRMGMDIVPIIISSQSANAFIPMQKAYIEKTEKALQKQVNKVRQSLKPAPEPVKVKGEMVVGYAADEILKYAEENDIDLILMATHGHSGPKRWKIGSVASKIMSASRIPVLLVRADVSEEIKTVKWPIETILVPLDGSEMAESVLSHVKTIGRQQGKKPVEVVLLRVCEPPTVPSYYGPELSGVPLDWGKYVEQEMVRDKERAREYLDELVKKFKEKGISVRSDVIQGKPDDEIVEYANKENFSLIVMATHGRSGLSRLVYGSVAANLINGVSSPILLIKPQDDKQKDKK
jgi:nucleotide-binding universal stress UspA family protein